MERVYYLQILTKLTFKESKIVYIGCRVIQIKIFNSWIILEPGKDVWLVFNEVKAILFIKLIL